MSRDRFEKEYVLDVSKEWELDGKAAEWASTGSWTWGQEQRCMNLADGDPNSERGRGSANMALSPDEAFFAIATNTVIRIYTAGSREVRAELVGHSGSVGAMAFVPDVKMADSPQNTAYMLISTGASAAGDEGSIIAWYLDDGGKSLTRTMPFAIGALADKALDAITADLTQHHELASDAVAEIRKGFVKTLTSADTVNRMHGLTSWTGRFGSSYKSTPFSADGRNWLSVIENQSTQRGSRPELELPTMVVRSLANSETVIHLRGHTDAIMWATFSPTDPDVLASAAWDGTFRIWSLSKGTFVHSMSSGRQNWSGHFSPDGKHILFSGTEKVAIYSVETGEELYSLQREGLEIDAWTRTLAWSPRGDAIALENQNGLLLWRPFEDDKVDVVLKLNAPSRLMSTFLSIVKIKWIDESGELLAAGTSEDSWFVWDWKRNLKWRMERPQGRNLDLWCAQCLYLKESKTFITLDGDRKLRDWSLDETAS